VIGLGLVGSVWARNYAESGVLAGGWNRTAQPDFPAWRPTAAAVVAAADAVQIVIADPPAVRAVLAEIAPALGPGKTVLQSSTIDPASSAEFHALVTGRGARYLETPFTGGKAAAEQRQTVFYLGGEAALVAEAEPLLSLISSARIHIGDHRQAATFKLAMNLNIAAQVEALGESLVMSRRAGIGDDVFFAGLGRNIAYSALMKFKEPKLRAGEFSPQFSVKHMAKDMRLAAGINGCEDFPVLDAVRERLAEALRASWGDEDFSATIKLL
jgi:3-hydroxyisobutyrate dehydrogenase-like beta-hydroxyacid dehydrogenase